MLSRTVRVCGCLVAAALLGGCSRESQSVIRSKLGKLAPKASEQGVPEGGWTPEAIAADPAGYLQHADGAIGTQIEGRRQKLAQLATTRASIDARAQALNTKVSDAENVIKRLTAATQRAEDEDNWPVKMAGRTFDQAQADAVRQSLTQFVADRQDLVRAYRDALNRVNATESKLKADIEQLSRMREKISLDMERVKLNQGLAELGDLHRTETELASFAKTLADISDEAMLGRLGSFDKATEAVDAESLLRVGQ
ncbi:MAG: hypothetical protein K8T26_10280 [Lentisphaerae bacterium]|nr:hypothetical protein [Lentisphaerota bacterium]